MAHLSLFLFFEFAFPSNETGQVTYADFVDIMTQKVRRRRMQRARNQRAMCVSSCSFSLLIVFRVSLCRVFVDC